MSIIREISDSVLKAEYARRYSIPDRKKIENSDSAAAIFADHLAAQGRHEALREHLTVLYLSGQNEVIKISDEFVGTVDSSPVYPREIVRACLDLGALSIILAHNHPSGCRTPSLADKGLTQRIKAALDLFGIKLLDHIIIGGSPGEYYSFADMSIL